jgi:hypothetical protein
VRSDGPLRGPYAIANDLAIAATNAEAEASAGGGWSEAALSC